MMLDEKPIKKMSPMMRHFISTKEKYKDTILLYRLGDFYELFFEDAELCSRVLGLTLTGKDCGLDERAPMCGIPVKALEPYTIKLIENGYKVAICEQLSEPGQNGKGIVDRDVVRVITPGTVIDSEMLDEKTNYYIAAIYKEKENIGISYIDISTGDFYTTEFSGENSETNLNDFLVMISPKEIISTESTKDELSHLYCLKSQFVPEFSRCADELFAFKTAESSLLSQLHTDDLKKFGCKNKRYAIHSAGALVSYLNETQKRSLSHINKIEYVFYDEHMQLDSNTRRNLELTATLKDGKKRGSLLWLLDKTKTSMGARMLKAFVENPLNNDKVINNRLKGVEELVKKIITRENLKELLSQIYDLERLTGKVAYGNLNPKDCLSLGKTLKLLPNIKNELNSFSSKGSPSAVP